MPRRRLPFDALLLPDDFFLLLLLRATLPLRVLLPLAAAAEA